MKDYAIELAAGKPDYNAKLNTMREYIQSYVLRVLHEQGFFHSSAFLGGTALRFLYNLPRFSEDLDFSVVPGKERMPFVELLKKLKSECVLAGYDVALSYNDDKTVQHAFFKFKGLMYEAGLSPLKSQNFSIKIEVDTHPPEGALYETRIVNRYFPVSFLSYDLPSLFAGKLHALLSRKYTKGRDFFDMGWYLSTWKDVAPNLDLLKNSLRQTGWKDALPQKDNWREFLYRSVEKADWAVVENDVKSFLERPADMLIFTKENILKLAAVE